MFGTNEISVQKAIEFAISKLAENNIENPRLESEILLAHILNDSRTNLILNNQRTLSSEDFSNFRELISRKCNHEPTAYILGEWEFFGRAFQLNSSVLIPRPETEELAEWILSRHRSSENLLDLCSGSGCIGITLALEMKVHSLTLSDISAEALKTAERNLSRLYQNPASHLILSDLFDDIPEQKFDLIVSNPPYIPQNEYQILERHVKDFEPRAALLLEFPEEFNRRLLEGCSRFLESAGWLYLETNPVYVESICRMMRNHSFINIESKYDLSGKERFICGQKTPD